MRLAPSSNSLPARLSFLLGVLCPPEVPATERASDTDRLAGVENVPLVPSGKDNVCMSTEDIAVVGFACSLGLPMGKGDAVDGFDVLRIDGLGGSGGQTSFSPSSPNSPWIPSLAVDALLEAVVDVVEDVFSTFFATSLLSMVAITSWVSSGAAPPSFVSFDTFGEVFAGALGDNPVQLEKFIHGKRFPRPGVGCGVEREVWMYLTGRLELDLRLTRICDRRDLPKKPRGALQCRITAIEGVFRTIAGEGKYNTKLTVLKPFISTICQPICHSYTHQRHDHIRRYIRNMQMIWKSDYRALQKSCPSRLVLSPRRVLGGLLL